ncbi:MAG: Gfo/Idh/MocA family oxidoreductase, partial [Verrucomicrobia bacterium]|nr:Gfo/Idh/MocA family oxidoreductase [Verrucomicrobiota bacterium]
NPKHVPGGKVVVAFKAASKDIPSSWDRVDGYTRELESKHGVKMVDSIEALCAQVDAVLIESVDGRPHLEQVRPVFKAGKPVFIDKPIAGTLRDAIEIRRLAMQHKVPCFTASAYRYYESMQTLMKTDVGEIRSAVSYGPAYLEPHHPDMFWYGIHPVEGLFTAMGRECIRVSRIATSETDIIAGEWEKGRTGTVIALRTGATPHKVTVFGSKGVAEQKGSGDYAPLVGEIMKFFQTGVAPVSLDETLEIFAFMEAADESKRRGGAPVTLREVLELNGYKF